MGGKVQLRMGLWEGDEQRVRGPPGGWEIQSEPPCSLRRGGLNRASGVQCEGCINRCRTIFTVSPQHDNDKSMVVLDEDVGSAPSPPHELVRD